MSIVKDQSCPWLYQSVKDSIPLALFILDSDFIIIDYNRRAQELLGCKGADFLGQPINNILKEDLWDKDSYLLRVINEGLYVENFESRVFNRRGEKIPVLVNAYPIKDKELIIGLVIYLADAREIKRYEAQKKQFMSMLAHDFKAPLVITLGLIRRLLEEKAGPITAKQQTYLKTISKELSRLESLILSFLDMLRFETGQYRLQLMPCELDTLIKEVCERFKLNAEKNDISLLYSLPSEGVQIVADRLQLERVLSNLIDNAIKYSPKGTKVRIRLSKENDSVVIRVEDEGQGIPQEALPHIFDPFYRVKTKKEGVSLGTGLGLTIVKNIVDAHGGSINVQSKPGQGTIFTVKIPRLCQLQPRK